MESKIIISCAQARPAQPWTEDQGDRSKHHIFVYTVRVAEDRCYAHLAHDVQSHDSVILRLLFVRVNP